MPTVSLIGYRIKCDQCLFSAELPNRATAKKRLALHVSLHKRFEIGMQVAAPDPPITAIGRIETIWWDWEEAVVIYDQKVDCFECVHPHMRERSWRGKLDRLQIPESQVRVGP